MNGVNVGGGGGGGSGCVVLLLGLVIIGLLVWGGAQSLQNNELQRELEPPNVTVMDSGVFVPPGAVKTAFGEKTPVRVHVSPPDADTMGAKSTDTDGTVHVWVPSRFLGGISSLTPAEAQEYALRELAKCPEVCQIDYATAGLNPRTVREMVSDENVERAIEESSEAMLVYIQNELYEFSLKLSSEDHRYALDKIVEVAKSGDQTQLGMMVASVTPAVVFAVAAVIGLVVFMLLRSGGGGK